MEERTCPFYRNYAHLGEDSESTTLCLFHSISELTEVRPWEKLEGQR